LGLYLFLPASFLFFRFLRCIISLSLQLPCFCF
jgi:hypothetical protein